MQNTIKIEAGDVMHYINRVFIPTVETITKVDYCKYDKFTPKVLHSKRGYGLFEDKITLTDFTIKRNGKIIYS